MTGLKDKDLVLNRQRTPTLSFARSASKPSNQKLGITEKSTLLDWQD